MEDGQLLYKGDNRNHSSLFDELLKTKNPMSFHNRRVTTFSTNSCHFEICIIHYILVWFHIRPNPISLWLRIRPFADAKTGLDSVLVAESIVNLRSVVILEWEIRSSPAGCGYPRPAVARRRKRIQKKKGNKKTAKKAADLISLSIGGCK